MKVAIIGAGVTGLCCAYELEKYNINPTIYEINSFVGETYSHVSASLEIISRPIRDPIKYFKKNFGLELKAWNNVKNIIHYSKNKTTEVKGNFGYFFIRSRDKDDIKNQIRSKLKKTEILLSTNGDYEALAAENDYVVIANGNYNFANELGCWLELLNTYVRGAVVLGDFDPNTLMVWINKDYCKNGYAYLAPFNDKKAAIVLIVTDIDEKEIDAYWELFLYTENIKYTIVEEFKQNHRSGEVFPHKVGNILLSGNTGGVIDPFLGFGVVNSVIMGIMAARSIALGSDYEKLIEWCTRKNKQLYEFRKIYEGLGNTGYDLLISTLKVPGLKHLMYYTPLEVVKYGAYALKPVNRKSDADSNNRKKN